MLLTSLMGFRAPILYPNKNEDPNNIIKAVNSRLMVRPLVAIVTSNFKL